MAAEAPAFAPVVLEGRWVRLEPLALRHVDGLVAAAADPAIWTWYHAPYDTPARVRAFVDEALRLQEQGAALPFVQVERGGGTVAGSTRFLSIERAHRRAEIGFTWLNPRWQRTPINTEAKFLLLRHAFEALDLIRVEFKTDSLNDRSRQALTRIGATEEGVFRNHMLVHGGRIRHSVYFSITREEWPRVKARLEALLARQSGARAA
jgi:N-acetyltransferase